MGVIENGDGNENDKGVEIHMGSWGCGRLDGLLSW